MASRDDRAVVFVIKRGRAEIYQLDVCVLY